MHEMKEAQFADQFLVLNEKDGFLMMASMSQYDPVPENGM
jgi:hypothetical protein